ncbi:cell division protein FtsH [Candidatus Wolfebacteria bacterium]|nr:MAG: cell division protein FtsH [Candidatus Wolfebacteria bacterium]
MPTQKSKKRKGKKNQSPKYINSIVTTILVFIIITALYSVFFESKKEIEEIAISDLAQSIVAGDVETIVVSGDKLTITLVDGTEQKSKKEAESSLSETLTNYGVSPENLGQTQIDIKSESGFVFWLLNILPFLIPIFFILIFFWFISKSVKGSGMQAFSFGDSKAKIIDPDDKKQRITFDDVAGVKEAKEELKEIVDFLKNPKKFLDIGAKIPKGVILTGAPGTGKTLLARAVAGEAAVPFFYLSGSEFVEMFVGVGASRVRDLFKMAKKMAPAIIFIDEIDAVGRVRGVGVGGGNDEREQTLNQILVEMDGFEPHEKVIVMAATNRSDVLDPALLRPGRFDRRVLLDLPDRNDREQILKIHAKKKPFAADVNLRVIAERTPGLSGADLESLMNEGAILAAREERKQVSQFDLIRSIEKVLLGPERKSHLMLPREKKIVAYHEAGHAILGSVLPHSDPVHKVTIVPRGHAGGYTMKLPIEERYLPTRKEFIDEIAVSLGGYVVEEMIFDDITTGPQSDLQVATKIARDMVTKYGMSGLGPMALDSARTITGSGLVGNEYSDDIAEKIDKEVKKIIDDGLSTAKKVLIKHRKALDAVAKELLDMETLEQDEYNKIIIAHGITPKTAEKKVVTEVKIQEA